MCVGDRLLWPAVGDVDRHAGVALAQAGRPLYRVRPVRRHAACFDVGIAAGGAQHVIRSAQSAGGIGADAHDCAAHRPAIEQAVEVNDAVYIGQRYAEGAANLDCHRLADIAV